MLPGAGPVRGTTGYPADAETTTTNQSVKPSSSPEVFFPILLTV